MPPRQRREASAERLTQLLTTTFEKYKSITSADDLRDVAMEAEEDEDPKINPTYAEVRDFLGNKVRSQVFEEENPSGQVVSANPFKKVCRWRLTI